mgnify:CR=1 FL=1
MILFDALIYNIDRYFGNFCFLIDNKTMKIKGLAPIFDNGSSLFSSLTIGDFLEINSMTGLNNYAKDKLNSFYGISFDVLVQNICSKDMINDLKKLNIEDNGKIRILSKEDLEELEVTEIKQEKDFVINYETEEVYYLDGYKTDDNNIVYSLTDISNLVVK